MSRRKKLYSDYFEDLYDGDEFEIENHGLSLGCCDCGSVHTLTLKVKKGRIFATVQKNDKATKKFRDAGDIHLLNPNGHEGYILVKLT